jgi:hypothetical protein
MFKKYIPLAFLFLIAVNLSCGSSRRSIAIEEGWEMLGELTVNFGRDRDAIDVRSSNRLTAIRFMVEDREVKLNELTIIFQNGDRLQPVVDEIIPPDTYSRVIDISNEGKYISRIEFKYRTTGNLLKGRAHVLVFGKRY